jgi:hypothetical protein
MVLWVLLYHVRSHNTLVVAYDSGDPELPACMISGDVAQWFR